MLSSRGPGSTYTKSVFYDEIGFGIFLSFNLPHLIWSLTAERLWSTNRSTFFSLREAHNVNVGDYIDFVSKIFNFCIQQLSIYEQFKFNYSHCHFLQSLKWNI